VSALRRFAEQFSKSFEIDIRVECNGFIDISDQLAREVIPVIHEGLSNIRKHTSAKSGTFDWRGLIVV
jgi:signal transduction histidine kinase